MPALHGYRKKAVHLTAAASRMLQKLISEGLIEKKAIRASVLHRLERDSCRQPITHIAS